MKLATRQTNTQVVGETEKPRTFNINANDVAFGVLSSGLYNDKIRAIIRELSCNAWDAHVMAGKKDVPFDLHLPTDFEPFFRITDYGVGLSHDDVLQLYCTYFASNKNQSNDVVGAMGLGSKSPFCYTQAQGDSQGFTVTSRFGGMKRIYSAYVDGGAPTIVCLSEEETVEPNGLEVQFAVNTDDVWEFENKAKLALEFFNPMPNVNIEGFEAKAEDYAIRTDTWALRSDEGGPRAVQGMVQYAVGSIDASRMTTEQQQVAELPLDLFFPIGELSVAASREMLSNDHRTINNILAMYTKVYTGMVDEVRKTLNKCKSAWEARLQLMVAMDSPIQNIIRGAYNGGQFEGKYDNFTLTNTKPALSELDYKALQVTKYSRSSRRNADRNHFFTTPAERKSDKYLLLLEELKINPKIGKNFEREFDVNDNVVFILNDLDNRGANKYVQAYVQNGRNDKGEHFCSTAYMFSPMSGKQQMKRMQKEFKKALATLGNPPFITVSYLKATYQPLVDARKPTPQPRVLGVLELTGDGTSSSYGRRAGWSKKTWSRTQADKVPVGDKKFYVPVVDKVLQSGVEFRNASDFVEFVNNVKSSKLFPLIDRTTRVFGLTVKSVEKMAGTPDAEEWVNLLDYIFENTQASIPDSKVLELSIYLQPFQCPHEELLKNVLRDDSFDTSHPLVTFAKSYFAVKGKKKEVWAQAATDTINRLVTMGKYKKGEMINFSHLWSQVVRSTYPMLALGFTSYGSSVRDVHYGSTVVEYIKLVDSQRKAEAK